MLFHLYKNYLYTISAKFRRQRLGKNPRALLTVVGLLVLPTLIVLQTQEMFRLWLEIPELGASFLFRFVSAALFGLFFVLVLTGIPVVLHHYFLAPDLALLGVLPLQKQDIYRFKYLTSSTGNLGLYVAVALPLLISMALAMGAHPIVYVAMLVVSLLFILVPTGLSILIALLLAQFFDVKKMRRAATLILGLFLVLTWGGFQFYRVSRLNPASTEFDPSTVDRFSALSQTLRTGVLPSDWLANSIYYSIQGQVATLVLNVLLLAALSFVLIQLTSLWRIRLEQREYRALASARPQQIKLTKQISSPGLRFALGVILKDLRLIVRDTRFLQTHILFLAMLLVWPFLQAAEPINPKETLTLIEPYIGLFFFTMFTSLILARQNLAMEQLAFQYIKLTPVSVRWWLLAKAGRVAMSVLLLLTIAVIVTATRTNTPLLWAVGILVVGALVAITSTFLGQTAAALGTRFDWVDPRYMVDMGWSYAFMFGTFVINGIGLAVLMLGISLSQQIVAFVVFFLYVGSVLGVSIRMSEQRLKTLQWTL